MEDFGIVDGDLAQYFLDFCRVEGVGCRVGGVPVNEMRFRVCANQQAKGLCHLAQWRTVEVVVAEGGSDRCPFAGRRSDVELASCPFRILLQERDA